MQSATAPFHIAALRDGLAAAAMSAPQQGASGHLCVGAKGSLWNVGFTHVDTGEEDDAEVDSVDLDEHTAAAGRGITGHAKAFSFFRLPDTHEVDASAESASVFDDVTGAPTLAANVHLRGCKLSLSHMHMYASCLRVCPVFCRFPLNSCFVSLCFVSVLPCPRLVYHTVWQLRTDLSSQTQRLKEAETTQLY